MCQSSKLILNIKYKHIMQNGELYLQQENWLKVKLSASLQDDCLASLVSHFFEGPVICLLLKTERGTKEEIWGNACPVVFECQLET